MMVMSNVLTLRVYLTLVASAELLCNQQTCESLRLTEQGDLATFEPWGYTTFVQASITLRLVNGATFDLPSDSLDIMWDYELLPSGLAVNVTRGVHNISALFTESIGVVAPYHQVQVVVFERGVVDATSPIMQVHCSGIWMQGVTRLTGFLSDGAFADLGQYSAMNVVYPLRSASKGTFYSAVQGVGIITWTFHGQSFSASVVASNSSLLVSAVNLPGVRPYWTDVQGSCLDFKPFITPSYDPSWTSYLVVMERIVRVQSSNNDSIGVLGIYHACILADSYDAVIITATITACDGQAPVTAEFSVEPHLFPSQPGGLDAGPETGLVIAPQDGQGMVFLSVYVWSDASLVRSFRLRVSFSQLALSPVSCTPGVIKDTQCGMLRAEGTDHWVVVGVDRASKQTGRVLLATLTFFAKAAGVSTLRLILDELILDQSWIIYNQTRSVWMRAGNVSAPNLAPIPSRLQIASAWGDTENVGSFTSVSVLFLEEFIFYSALGGSRKICLTKCQLPSNVTAWQRKTMDPVRRPDLPPRPPSRESKLFLIGVLVGSRFFLADWSISYDANRTAAIQLSIEGLGWNPLPLLVVSTQLNQQALFTEPSFVVGQDVRVSLRQSGASLSVGTVLVLANETLVPVRLLVLVQDLSSFAANYLSFTFLPSAPLDYLNFTRNVQDNVTAPPPPPPSTSLPFRMDACCDINVTYPGSPAVQLYPTEFSLQFAVVTRDDNTVGFVPWQAVEFSFDNTYLYHTGYNNWTVRDGWIYTKPVVTRIYLAYTESNATTSRTVRSSVVVSILDVARFRASLLFPAANSTSLRRLHCSPCFESAAAAAEIFVDALGSWVGVSENVFLIPSNASVVSVMQGLAVVGVSPGYAVITVAWGGFTQDLALTVLDESVLLTDIDCEPVNFGGRFNSSWELAPSGVMGGRRVPNLFFVRGCTSNPYFLSLTIPEYAACGGGQCRALSNSDVGDAILYTVPACQAAQELRCSADFIVNFEADPYDIDLGNFAGHALETPETTPVYLHHGFMGVTAHLVQVYVLGMEVLSCASEAFCSFMAPYWVVRFSGAGPAKTGLLPIGSLSLRRIPNSTVRVTALVEVIVDNTRTSSVTQASRWSLFPPLIPAQPSLALLDLWTVSRSPQDILGSLTLVEKQRVVTPMVFSSDTELTAMVRLLYRDGLPDLNRSRVWILFSSQQDFMQAAWAGAQSTEWGAWVPAPHFQDGWYGVQFKGGVWAEDMSIAFALETTMDDGDTSSDRKRTLGVVSIDLFGDHIAQEQGFTLTAGLPLAPCPYRAAWPGVVQIAVVLELAADSPPVPSDTLQRLSCCLSIFKGRIQVNLAPNGWLQLSATVESFLRAREVYSSLMDPRFLVQCLGIVVVKASRRSLPYNLLPSEPPRPCPQDKYYDDTGSLKQLPPHATHGYDCYGFKCNDNFEIYSGQCVPAYAPDNIYWTSMLAATATLLLTAVVAVCIRIWVRRRRERRLVERLLREPDPEPPYDESESALPVAVDEAGRLVFEMIQDSDSESSCSTQSDADKTNPESENPAELEHNENLN